MKASQAYGLLVIMFVLITGCKKELRKTVYSLATTSIAGTQSFGTMICIPRNLDSAVNPNTTISLTLDKFDISKVYSAQIALFKGYTGLSGKQKFTANEVSFTPDEPLELGTAYKVEVLLILETTAADARQVSINGSSGNKRLDTIHQTVSWRFTTLSTYRYTMNRRSQWVTSFNRDGNKVVQMGEYLYSYGGWTSVPDMSYNDVYRSSGDLTRWERLPDAPWEGRHTYGIGKIDSTLFVFGGDYLSTRFDVWKSSNGVDFAPLAQDLESLLGPRFLYGACVHDSKLFILGGQSGLGEDSARTDVWSSNNGSRWKRLADNLPFLGKNIAGSVASFANKIWVVGGGYYRSADFAQRYTNQVFTSEDGSTWQQEPDAPWTPRQYGDLCVWNNRLWMIGGYNEENLSDIWYMDTDGEWHQFETPPLFEARHASGVGVYNDKLVIVCGNYLNDCWVIEKI